MATTVYSTQGVVHRLGSKYLTEMASPSQAYRAISRVQVRNLIKRKEQLMDAFMPQSRRHFRRQWKGYFKPSSLIGPYFRIGCVLFTRQDAQQIVKWANGQTI